MENLEALKELAAKAAVEYVKDGHVVGLSGVTAPLSPSPQVVACPAHLQPFGILAR